MEANHHHPATRRQCQHNGLQHLAQCIQLAVDVQANRLKTPGRGVLVGLPLGIGRRDDLSQLSRALNLLGRPGLHDGRGNTARKPLFPQLTQHLRQLGLIYRGQPLCS